MKPIIEIENLSKEYTLFHKLPYHTLRDTLTNIVKKPLNILQGKNKSQKQEKFLALNNINLEINEGERVGIIGRNGAGKSTLLKILSKITPPTTGEIRLRGRVASLLEVGTGFHPELTGRENIYLNGAILGMKQKEIAKKFDEIVDFSEIEKFLDTPVKRYSSGMYVRLAFAVAAHLEPEILIVDEVLAVGDAQFQKKCLGKMEDVANQGRTILFVSHNMAAIRSLCSRAILIDNGKIIADDQSSCVIQKYINNQIENILNREWENEKTAPQNNSIILKKASIIDEIGRPHREVHTDTSFILEVQFHTKTEDATAGFAIILFDAENNCVLSSISNHEKNWYGKSMPKGIYASKCKIPANLLNNGRISITINLFSKGFSDAVTASDVLKIDILDGPSVRGDFYGDFGGKIRPLFDWETQLITKY